VRALQRKIGISEKEIRAIERAREAELLPPADDRFWRIQVEQVLPSESGDLDKLAQAGLERLLAKTNPEWLRSERQKPYRLGSAYVNNPLHLVNGARVGLNLSAKGPQRFARMLLIAQDHVMKRDDVDFFSAAMSVPEVAQLGNRLDEIRELGPEAERKLAALPSMPDDMVSATVYELLVGAACVRKGLELTMVPEDRSRKVPDYQVSNIGAIPGAIECKRRLGLTAYELDEAECVETLYNAVRPFLHKHELHVSMDVSFSVPLRSVSAEDFADPVLASVRKEYFEKEVQTAWGSFAIQLLPYLRSTARTRLYSPEYLEQVFDWNTLQDQWDGLLCEVEAPDSIAVEISKMPLCLKWRSANDVAPPAFTLRIAHIS